MKVDGVAAAGEAAEGAAEPGADVDGAEQVDVVGHDADGIGVRHHLQDGAPDLEALGPGSEQESAADGVSDDVEHGEPSCCARGARGGPDGCGGWPVR